MGGILWICFQFLPKRRNSPDLRSSCRVWMSGPGRLPKFALLQREQGWNAQAIARRMAYPPLYILR